MKTIIILFFVIISANLRLQSTIIEVKQDGTGDFFTIQDGIDSSSNSDTVLVYPGTYYENINFNGKHLTLSSLELITENESYIDSTIVDGNQTGSCIRLDNEEQNVIIRGFSITNGSGDYYTVGYYGGGISIYTHFNDIDHITLEIINCNFYENYSNDGGGAIFNKRSDLILSGCNIYNNFAGSGGGIYARDDCHLIFDETNQCNIYNNYAGTGCDILAVDAINDIHVVLDTFTVLEPDGYFACYYYNLHDEGEMTFDIHNNWLEQVNHDLYVATDGDDTNSGTTPEEPFQTIVWALHKIISDSLNPNTIHLADGTYSRELNGQIFPLGAKNYVSIAGSINGATTLLNTYASNLFKSHSHHNFSLKNLTFQNSNNDFITVLYFFESDEISFKNLIIENCVNSERIFSVSEGGNFKFDNVILRYNTAIACAGLRLDGYVNVKMKNCILDNNDSIGDQYYGWTSNFYCRVQDSLKIENCIFSNSSSLREDVYTFSIGTSANDEPIYEIINSLFYNNESPNNYCFLISNGSDNPNNIINCTFANNTSQSGTLVLNGLINMNNSIMYNNTQYEIRLHDYSSFDQISTLNVDHCDIRNGFNGIYNENNANTVNWLDGNLNEDPLFIGDGDYPFALSELSPCIDAGTLDLPEGIELPEYDLAGNPRIVGESIDMGAYEFQDSVAVTENIQYSVFNSQLSNFPNPFKSSTSIKLEIKEESHVVVEIFNVKGQKVRTLMDVQTVPGRFEMIWRGKGDDNRKVASGIYFCKLTIDDEEKAYRKMILLR